MYVFGKAAFTAPLRELAACVGCTVLTSCAGCVGLASCVGCTSLDVSSIVSDWVEFWVTCENKEPDRYVLSVRAVLAVDGGVSDWAASG